jgi:hypothetical protein
VNRSEAKNDFQFYWPIPSTRFFMAGNGPPEQLFLAFFHCDGLCEVKPKAKVVLISREEFVVMKKLSANHLRGGKGGGGRPAKL